jgi:hypothetical protein
MASSFQVAMRRRGGSGGGYPAGGIGKDMSLRVAGQCNRTEHLNVPMCALLAWLDAGGAAYLPDPLARETRVPRDVDLALSTASRGDDRGEQSRPHLVQRRLGRSVFAGDFPELVHAAQSLTTA